VKQPQDEEAAVGKLLPAKDATAYFELVGYPVKASAAMNEKFLATDLSYLDGASGQSNSMLMEATRAHASYESIQRLTEKYNSLVDGKWDGIMSASPRERHVFEMPQTGEIEETKTLLPASWHADVSSTVDPPSKLKGFHEEHFTVSINAAHFADKFDGTGADWKVLRDPGISGDRWCMEDLDC